MERYTDPKDPAALGGVMKFARATKQSQKKAQELLLSSDTYTKFRPLTHRFTRRRTIARHRFELMQADLADFQKYARDNKGYRYVLVVVDVLSKFVFYEPLKSKNPGEIINAFKRVFKVAKPKLLQTDQGGEFTATSIQTYLKKQNVHWYHTYSEVKAALAERMIRTLKEKLARFFYHSGSHKYYHVLPQLASAYNNTPHSSTKIAPNQVTAENEQMVFQKLYGTSRREPKKLAFNIGDYVRITNMKGIFAKGYDMKWSEEMFRVVRIKNTDPHMFYLQDEHGDDILGGFYRQELSRILRSDNPFYDIEKVLRKRRHKDGHLEHFVKFKGYGPEFNQWVSALVNVKDK
jgi:hypothetical protein